MTALLLSVLAASFLGSLHCAGMCGGLSAFYASACRPEAVGRAHAAYHGARLVSYGLLGGIAGALGQGVDRLGTKIGLVHVAAAIAGLVVIGWGFSSILSIAPIPAFRSPSSGGARSAVLALLRRFQHAAGVTRAAVLGVCTAVLPCGWLYAFVLLAAGTSSPTHGALLMATFWVGTVPALLVLGGAARRLARRLGARAPLLTGGAVVAAGLVTVFMRSTLHLPDVPVSALSGDAAPCHAH